MTNTTIGEDRGNSLWAPLSILLAGLSLSIGWGIRGNYGHEVGAMLPGALAAVAVCLVSGRADWRERVAYFACFGALGWAFGGSMSYMQVISYTQSGHAPSQYFGFWGLFLIGFLWAALGAAGTMLPATLDRKGLCDLFRPLSLLLALWCVLYFVEDPLTHMVQTQYGPTLPRTGGALRHESVFYWLDSDWLSVTVILAGILAFDLVDRHFSNSLWLLVLAAAGAAAGHIAEIFAVRAGWSGAIGGALVRPQGDTALFGANRLITNWPALFLEESRYIGAAIGLIAGIGVYFALFGKFRRGSGLFLSMALGWLVGFLLLPVLLGVRLTPPRGDNWAGVLGTYVGVLIYAIRHKWWPLLAASLVAGTIGGIGFSGIACLESVMQSAGNPNLAPGIPEAWGQWQRDPALQAPPAFLLGRQPGGAWEFWQQSNWHSFLEQSYGFVNGVGLIVAFALVARRIGQLDNEGRRRHWTEILAVTLSVPVLMYVNLVKNVAAWTETHPGHPAALSQVMRVPLIGFPLSTYAWFNIFFGLAAVALVVLLSIHTRRPLAVLEQSWVGRGQLLYLVLVWAFVIGNFGRALVSFEERRLLTEGTITFNAILVTLMILLLPRPDSTDLPAGNARSTWLLAGSVAATIVCAALLPPLETRCVRALYGDAPVRARKEGPEMRFGPRATWRQQPLLKGMAHR